MADKISTLPDDVLCYILSFLPTEDVVATCVLSKRWEHLWRPVPALDFDCDRDLYSYEGINSHFLQKRDLHPPLHRLRLRCYHRCYHTTICNATNFYQLDTFTVAVQHRLQHLDLSIPGTKLPSVVLSCKTFVVLKLMCLSLEAFSSVDLPLLKILRLHQVSFSEYRFLAKLLSGCPSLENMKVTFIGFGSYVTEAKFKKLSKLVRVRMDKDIIPLEVIHNVQFLRMEWMDRDMEFIEDFPICHKIPKFHNLIHIEFGYVGHTNDWGKVLKVLKHCPKLQNLVIDQIEFHPDRDRRECQYPLRVPKCISSHLKTCRIINYGGHETEFEFARYIMQNARLLQDMTICLNFDTTEGGKHEMMKKLSLCTRISSICKLTFSCLDEDDIWVVNCVM